MKNRIKKGVAVVLALTALAAAGTVSFGHAGNARHMLRVAGHMYKSRG